MNHSQEHVWRMPHSMHIIDLFCKQLSHFLVAVKSHCPVVSDPTITFDNFDYFFNIVLVLNMHEIFPILLSNKQSTNICIMLMAI